MKDAILRLFLTMVHGGVTEENSQGSGMVGRQSLS